MILKNEYKSYINSCFKPVSFKDDYKRSIEQWGENPSATKLYEKMKADTLI